MFPQYGELRPTSGGDQCGSLGQPSYFQRVLCLGSVTAQYSSSGRQPNFAALNIGRHLYSAGRPSRWASAHILVCYNFPLRLHRIPWEFPSIPGFSRFVATLISVGLGFIRKLGFEHSVTEMSNNLWKLCSNWILLSVVWIFGCSIMSQHVNIALKTLSNDKA